MADQKINALPTKTAPVTGDKCLMSGAAEEYLIDYDKLATAILNKLTSKTFTLDQGTKTLIAALNELNSKSVLAYDFGRLDCNSYVYNSDECLQKFKSAFAEAPNARYFSGVLYAKRISTAGIAAGWRIDGFKSNNENGYVKISTYVEGYVEHTLSNYIGDWEWVD